VVDYGASDVNAAILEAAGAEGVKLVVDCIGSLRGSMKPSSRVVKSGAVVAVMLPVVVKDTSEPGGPSYEIDVTKGVK
jgi:hypothetical protein